MLENFFHNILLSPIFSQIRNFSIDQEVSLPVSNGSIFNSSQMPHIILLLYGHSDIDDKNECICDCGFHVFK